MKRTAAKLLLLLILPVAMAVTALQTVEAKGPYWMGFNCDPDYMYLLNSLNLARLHAVGHVDNPGTTVQVAGAAVLRTLHLLRHGLAGDIETDVLTNPELYLKAINTVFVVVNMLALITLGLVTYWLSRSISLAMAIQLSPLLPRFIAVFPYGISAVRPESLLFLASNLMALLLILYLHSTDRRLRQTLLAERWIGTLSPETVFAISFGVLCGFGLATKATFLPLLLIPAIVLPTMRQRFVFGIGTVVTFAIITLPIARQYPAVFSSLFSILTHSGTHGSGSEEILNPSVYLRNLTALLGANRWVLLITAVSIYTLVHDSFKRRARGRSEGGRHIRVLAAVTLAQVAGVLMVAKHFRGWELYYLLPATSLSAVALMLNLYFEAQVRREQPGATDAGRWSAVVPLARGIAVTAIIFALSLARLGGEGRGYQRESSLLKKQRFAAFQKAEAEYGDHAKIYYIAASSPAYALSLGNENANFRFSDFLSTRYPDVYIYYPWTGVYKDWYSESWGLSAILARHDNKVVFQGPVFEQLFEDLSGDTNLARSRRPDAALVNVAGDASLPPGAGSRREAIYEIDPSPGAPHGR